MTVLGTFDTAAASCNVRLTLNTNVMQLVGSVNATGVTFNTSAFATAGNYLLSISLNGQNYVQSATPFVVYGIRALFVNCLVDSFVSCFAMQLHRRWAKLFLPAVPSQARQRSR